jgi:hypothetical protein
MLPRLLAAGPVPEWLGWVCAQCSFGASATEASLLFHADPRAGAVMIPTRAVEIAAALTAAAEDR